MKIKQGCLMLLVKGATTYTLDHLVMSIHLTKIIDKICRHTRLDFYN